MYDSGDLYQKREAVLDELDRIIDKSEDRRAINEKKARAEISLLEDAIKKQKEKNEKLARPVPGRVSSPLYISDTEYDTPSENSEENSTDEEELELLSKSTSLLISILINLNFSLARNSRILYNCKVRTWFSLSKSNSIAGKTDAESWDCKYDRHAFEW